jgi:hypothetical protein
MAALLSFWPYAGAFTLHPRTRARAPMHLGGVIGAGGRLHRPWATGSTTDPTGHPIFPQPSTPT